VRDLVDLLPIVLVAQVLWLSGLTLVFWRLLSHYRNLIKKARGGDLISALENVIRLEEKNSAEAKRLKEALDRLAKKSVFPIQKIGLVRFNPFSETGGDQSFSLCLLDGTDTGFILTALHTRDRTRVYTKSVSKGKSKYELSADEQKVLKEAQK
jgi:hypothetical protein